MSSVVRVEPGQSQGPGTPSSFLASHVSGRNPDVWAPVSWFPCAFARSWIGGRAARNWKQAVLYGCGNCKEPLAHCAVPPAPRSQWCCVWPLLIPTFLDPIPFKHKLAGLKSLFQPWTKICSSPPPTSPQEWWNSWGWRCVATREVVLVAWLPLTPSKAHI